MLVVEVTQLKGKPTKRSNTWRERGQEQSVNGGKLAELWIPATQPVLGISFPTTATLTLVTKGPLETTRLGGWLSHLTVDHSAGVFTGNPGANTAIPVGDLGDPENGMHSVLVGRGTCGRGPSVGYLNASDGLRADVRTLGKERLCTFIENTDDQINSSAEALAVHSCRKSSYAPFGACARWYLKVRTYAA